MPNVTTAYGGNETLIENPYLCTLQTCDLSLASFSYLPSLPGNALYLAIFLLLFIAHAVLGSIYRTWGFLVALLFGLALEIVGYLGRIMYHNNPFNDNNFLIYLVCVTIAPAFLTAGIYLCLARIVTVYGAQFSRFRPRTYTLIFCTFDFFSLVLQGLGGGIASTANSHSGSNLGKNIMIAGLAFQVVSLLIFGLCCGEFAMRLRANPAGWNAKYPALVHSTRFKSFLWALAIGTFAIFVRSVFRVVELSEGFNGRLFNEEIPFMLLEGPMIIIACSALAICHPGASFQGHWHDANFVFWEKLTLRSHKKSQSDVIGLGSIDEESRTHTSHGNVVMSAEGK